MTQGPDGSRYRSAVPDWRGFERCLTLAPPVTGWMHPLRVSDPKAAAAAWLGASPTAWHPRVWRLHGGGEPSRSWAHRVGLFHLQEEASVLAAHLLDPQPGDRVLDLCASPGGKTAWIGLAMKNHGLVVANEWSLKRHQALRANTERLGLTSVITTHQDGASFAAPEGWFDRVLVDVPCSCEGNVRFGASWSAGPWERLRALQRRLLLRAVDLCRPGGRIVYSTCTYAPEENESVVHQALLTGRARMIAQPTPLRGSPGLTGFAHQCYHPSLEWAHRFWGHESDTGGFFVAVLERTGTGRIDRPTTHHPKNPSPLADSAEFQSLQRRFGFCESALEPLALETGGRHHQFVGSMDAIASLPLPGTQTRGIRLYSRKRGVIKLSNPGTLLLGGAATQNSLALSEAEAMAYLRRESFPWAGCSGPTGPGFVIVTHQGHPLGVGLFRDPPGQGASVESLFPRAFALSAQSG